MTQITQTREERLAIIKIAAERVAKRNAMRIKMKKGAIKAYLAAAPHKEIIRKKEIKYQEKMEAMNENYNHYTDAPKYVKEYYGEVYRDTTKYDNEWN